MSKNSIILFICHDKTTVFNVLQKVNNANIIFVGDQLIDNELRNIPNIIFARELPNNIEVDKKLLTFTAWYLVIKNNLFMDYEYICLLENDVLLNSSFITNLENETIKNEEDIISFNHGKTCFNRDISMNVFSESLKIKQIDSENMITKIKTQGWYPSTNQCIKRELLSKFVDWYYPFCYFINIKDPVKFSWYHERLFTVFIYDQNLKVKLIRGLSHLSNKSHEKTCNLKTDKH